MVNGVVSDAKTRFSNGKSRLVMIMLKIVIIMKEILMLHKKYGKNFMWNNYYFILIKTNTDLNHV